MSVKVGFIPYLNMAPFHQGFGPDPVEKNGYRFEFKPMSPRTLGLEAEKETVDAGALSLVDYLRLSDTYELLGPYGIGLKRSAQSVFVFSKKPLAELSGVCAVTDETSTSYRLLQVILEARYGRTAIHYGRIPSLAMFDGDADAVLLIGDEALSAHKQGIKGFPVVTDLGDEWFAWQGVPFVFARWAVRKAMDTKVKETLSALVEASLASPIKGSEESKHYWEGFAYRLGPEHERSQSLFAGLMEKIPSSRLAECQAS